MEFTNLNRLCGQTSPSILLPLPSQHGDYRCCQNGWFLCGSWGSSSHLLACVSSTLLHDLPSSSLSILSAPFYKPGDPQHGHQALHTELSVREDTSEVLFWILIGSVVQILRESLGTSTHDSLVSSPEEPCFSVMRGGTERSWMLQTMVENTEDQT